MRTTIQIDDDLHDLARQHVVAKGKTFTALVEEALREKWLPKVKTSVAAVKKRVQLRTVSGKGTQSGVDPNDFTSLLNLME